jgi:predicted RNA methylase
MEIVNRYSKSAPSTQNALDIFSSEWTSKLPEPYANLVAGELPLFDDGRIKWAIKSMGGINGKTILELGPLEGGHSYMLERLGAKSITAIEANTHAYLRCLIIKNLLDLNRVRFIYGDFVEFLRLNKIKFDIVIASGVLYHMMNPVEVIGLLANTTDKIFIWTHYYDYDIIKRNNQDSSKRFTGSINSGYGGFEHTLYRQEYNDALNLASFCGGNNQFSYWMDRNELLDCLRYFGFDNIRIGFEDPNHPNGPAFALVAFRDPEGCAPRCEIRSSKDNDLIYTVGRAIQCYKDHGMSYTLKKTFEHLQNNQR